MTQKENGTFSRKEAYSVLAGAMITVMGANWAMLMALQTGHADRLNMRANYQARIHSEIDQRIDQVSRSTTSALDRLDSTIDTIIKTIGLEERVQEEHQYKNGP